MYGTYGYGPHCRCGTSGPPVNGILCDFRFLSRFLSPCTQADTAEAYKANLPAGEGRDPRVGGLVRARSEAV